MASRPSSGAKPWAAASLERGLAALPAARVAVLGDFAIDAYWMLDPDWHEHSLETGLPVQRVAAQRYGLGGAGNVTHNLRSLGVKDVRAVGLLGDDPFGRELTRLLRAIGAGVEGMRPGPAGWQTLVFAKPHRNEQEQPRFDFGSNNRRDASTTEAVIAQLDQAARACTAVVLNQQAPAGLLDAATAAPINAVIARHPSVAFVVDSRDHAPAFKGATIKVNAAEAARWCGEALQPELLTVAARRHAQAITAHTGQPVFVTCGAAGLVVADQSQVALIQGIALRGRVDPVGAGDTVVATIAAVLGSGGNLITAAHLANLAAAVTVSKVGTTGTATPEEILQLAAGSGCGES